MSIDPHWFSTIYGILFIGNQGLSAMAFTIAVIVLLARTEPMGEVFRRLSEVEETIVTGVELVVRYAGIPADGLRAGPVRDGPIIGRARCLPSTVNTRIVPAGVRGDAELLVEVFFDPLALGHAASPPAFPYLS